MNILLPSSSSIAKWLQQPEKDNLPGSLRIITIRFFLKYLILIIETNILLPIVNCLMVATTRKRQLTHMALDVFLQ